MNKKTLFLILLGVLILPSVVLAADSTIPSEASTIADNVKGLTVTIGMSIVVIGWVIAGILYLTAGGGERLAVAKKALIAAVIGTVLVAIAVGGYPIISGIINSALSTGT